MAHTSTHPVVGSHPPCTQFIVELARPFQLRVSLEENEQAIEIASMNDGICNFVEFELPDVIAREVRLEVRPC